MNVTNIPQQSNFEATKHGRAMLPGGDDVIRWICRGELFILFIAKFKTRRWRRRLSFSKYSYLIPVGIIIRFLGEANTEWTEEKSVTTSEGKTENEVTQLKGHEEYFKIQYYLLGGKNSKYTKTDRWFSQIFLKAARRCRRRTCEL